VLQCNQHKVKMVTLRPFELHIEPEQPDAASMFNFWLRTDEDFISTVKELRKDDDPEVNKKRIIINCLSPAVYPQVKEAETYDMICQILKALYVKKNNVYARHLLVSRRQGSDESISEFLHVLKGFAKDCSFSDVTADPVFPLRKFYTEQMFALLRTKRMQMRNHANIQPAKRSQR